MCIKARCDLVEDTNHKFPMPDCVSICFLTW
jgi:hypothetical protein